MKAWLIRYNPSGQAKTPKVLCLDDSPCPAIMAGGMGGQSIPLLDLVCE